MSIIGVISDTHGLLRPEVLRVLKGSEIIIHAGDIGATQVIDELSAIAPVYAVRGNVDTAPCFSKFPITEYVRHADINLYVLHNLDDLDLDPSTADIAVIIYGHSHQPLMEKRDNVLYFNPGSAGPKRFKLPIAVGRLEIGPNGIEGDIISLPG